MALQLPWAAVDLFEQGDYPINDGLITPAGWDSGWSNWSMCAP
ncbi:MAG: hypothetical protein ACLR0N_17465 [Bilophila wadsworthia]